MSSAPNLTFSPSFRRLLLLAVSLNCLAGIKRIAESFFVPEIYSKDFVSPYLLAKAILNGVPPYLPLPELASRWLSEANNFSGLNHATPHPPIVGLLSLPFGLLPYKTAALAWLTFELACLLTSLLLVLRWWGKPLKKSDVALYFVLALGWLPIIEELWLGQYSSLLLAFLLGALLALRANKYGLSGALLGAVIALKLTGWPIVILLALRRKWRGVAAAVGVATIANLTAMGVLGINTVQDYYLKVGPAIAAIYRLQDTNYSTWTLGQRLFAGHGYNFSALPLWHSEYLAGMFTYLIPLSVLFCGLWFALKARTIETGFGLLVGVGILISPTAWSHYMVLGIIPILMVAQRLWTLGCPRRLSYLAFCFFLPLSISGPAYSTLTTRLAYQTTPDGIPMVHFVTGLINLIPAVALISMLWLLWYLDSVRCVSDPDRSDKNRLSHYLPEESHCPR